MIDTEALRRALGELERNAPAEAEVLAGLRAGIARRRRRRQVWAVSGALVAAGLVVLGVVLALPSRPAGFAVVSQAPDPSDTPPGTTLTTLLPAPSAPVLPFTVGGLPVGYQLEFWQVGTGRSGADYIAAGEFERIAVEVDDRPRDGYEISSERPVTIAGRPGRVVRLAPDKGMTELRWQLADGRWAMVSGRAPELTEAQLHTVAENLTAHPTPVETSTGLLFAALPAGYLVNGWSGMGSRIIGGDLCRTPVDPRDRRGPDDCISVGLNDGTAPDKIENVRTAAGMTEINLDQVEVVNGVTTRASLSGEVVYAQLDPGHWLALGSGLAGVRLLRQVAATVIVRS